MYIPVPWICLLSFILDAVGWWWCCFSLHSLVLPPCVSSSIRWFPHIPTPPLYQHPQNFQEMCISCFRCTRLPWSCWWGWRSLPSHPHILRSLRHWRIPNLSLHPGFLGSPWSRLLSPWWTWKVLGCQWRWRWSLLAGWTLRCCFLVPCTHLDLACTLCSRWSCSSWTRIFFVWSRAPKSRRTGPGRAAWGSADLKETTTSWVIGWWSDRRKTT